MTRNKSSTLEPFDLEIKRTLRRLCNLVEEKVSPKKERPTMEETRVLRAAILQVLVMELQLEMQLESQLELQGE